METVRESKGTRREGMESIAERLSLMEDLYFPRAIQPTAINPSQRKSILLDLLSRDVAVFLGTSLCLSVSVLALF